VKVLIKASVLGDVEGPTIILIELDDARKQRVLSRWAMFQAAKNTDKDLYEITFWDIPGYFYDVDWDALEKRLGEKDVNQFDSEEYLVVPDDFVLPESCAAHTDVHVTHFTERGIYFRAGLKCGAYVESRRLPFTIRKVGEHEYHLGP